MNQFRLFALGESFDVDAFVSSSNLKPDRVWRRGDQRPHPTRPHPQTNGVEFVLGDGWSVPFSSQEEIAISYLKSHRKELKELAKCVGVERFYLGLQYVLAKGELDFVVSFALGPSACLMWHCLDVGCEPLYYVEFERPVTS